MAVPAGQLAAMRNRLNANLTDTCDTARDANRGQLNGSGAPKKPNLQPHLAGQRCRLTQHRGTPEEVAIAGSVSGSQFFLLVLPYGTDIVRDDTVIIGGISMTVIGVDMPRTNAIGTYATVRSFQ